MDTPPKPDAPSSLQLYLRLLNYTRKYWRVFAASLVGLIFVSGTEIMMPMLVQA